MLILSVTKVPAEPDMELSVSYYPHNQTIFESPEACW